MAAIDKIYLKDYNTYKDFLNWAKNTKYECPNGLVIEVYKYVYGFWSDKDFINKEIPVLNSNYSLDYFLIKYCPFKFVQDRLKYLYNKEYFLIKSERSDFDKFIEVGIDKTKRKIKIIKNLNKRNYLYKTPMGYYQKFSIEVKTSEGIPLFFNETLNRFLYNNELGEWDSTYLYFGRSLKALIRKIRNLNLPKNSTITATGIYINETIILKIK